MPVYFVCGIFDWNLRINKKTYRLLTEAENQNLAFVTFPGRHVYRQKDIENMYLWMHTFGNTGRDF